MKRKGAQGPDDIPPTFLKELGPKALEELLQIFNICFRTASCPQVWRLATILPLLKAGKVASILASFRPISLTSCVSKCFERMLAERLYHLAETKGIFDNQQAGFRKGRGCDDQIARIIQAIQDGFNEKKMKRSVLVLLDFSKAYDTVWRERLLVSMIEDGVPMTMIRWLRSFFENRQARVKFNGKMSNSRKMKQGLPQGSVLSPILFLFYINQLAKILPRDTINSLFADDVSALATTGSKEESEAVAQRTVDVVVEWAEGWKVMINADKSEASFFTTWSREAQWMPVIRIDGEAIKQVKSPRLIGVYVDRNLFFGPHVDHLIEKTQSKEKMLRAVANTDWGWKKEKLIQIFTAHCTSTMQYASFAWSPSTAPTHLGRLQRAENKLLRAVTGQYMATPVEALRLECGLPDFKTSMDRMVVKAAEKAIRLDEEHPRRLALEGSTNHTRKQPNWRAQAHKLSANLPRNIVPRTNIDYFPTPPWITATNLEVYPLLEGVKSRHDDLEVKRTASIRRIKEVDADITIYTDGITDSGYLEGGSGVVITRGDAEHPEVLETIIRKGAAYTCSYEEEVDAAITAAQWINLNCTEVEKILICTDSQSLCMALNSYNVETAPIRAAVHNSPAEIIIQWIPGHSDVPGNEMADAAAKEGTELEIEYRPVSFRSACMMTNKCIPNQTSHEVMKKVYQCYSTEKEKEEITTRKDQVLLAQLRSGKHKVFATY